MKWRFALLLWVVTDYAADIHAWLCFYKLITLQKCRSIYAILISCFPEILDKWKENSSAQFLLLSYFVLVISAISVEFPVLIPV